ncbi:hypothetical protein [Vibrio sp. 10N.237.312.B06]|uniref:hypothetical protein n=1 Tax=Vibrio sp. 10N.237.312.B06 TaxID=3229974 RepID=UPI00354D8937
MIAVLVVEDSDLKFEKIRSALEDFGVEKEYIDRTITIDCSEKQLAENKYDLVILDMVLPYSLSDSSEDKEGGLSILEDIISAINGDNELQIPTITLILSEFEDVLNEFTDAIEEHQVFSLIYDSSSRDWVDKLGKEVRKLQRIDKQNSQRKFDKNVLITIHGIRTNRKWQTKLDNLLDCTYSVESYKYNFFPLPNFLSKDKVDKEISELVDFLDKTIKKYPKAKFNFVSHSFGTYLIYNALSRISKNIPIGNIIFGGSVLSPSVNISKLYEKHNIDNIVNDCVLVDIPIIAGVLTNSRYSNAGIVGIKGSENQIVNRYFNGGHSSYFKDKRLEEWIYILNTGIIENRDVKNLGLFYDFDYPLVSSKRSLRIIVLFITSISIFGLASVILNSLF